jgi:hypothetical protein
MSRNVIRGALFGFTIGGLLWILTAVLRLTNASTPDPGLLSLAVVFLAGGIAGGAIAGAMVSLARWRTVQRPR